MPIDQTIRGLALEIDASTDAGPETQPLLEYRFIDSASTQTILARIIGIPQSNGGGSWPSKLTRELLPRPSGCLSTTMAMSASERQVPAPDWMSPVTRGSADHCQFKALSK